MPWLGVFETLRVVDGCPLFFSEHLAELDRAMFALGLTCRLDLGMETLKLAAKSGRWRWVVNKYVTTTQFNEEEPSSTAAVPIRVSPVRVGSFNWDARFKTVSRLSYAQAGLLAGEGDAVLLNESGAIASTSRGNIFWVRDRRLFTPAHEAGCRCGVVRGFVLGRERVETGHYPLRELLDAEEIFLTNSMRGIVSVSSIEGRDLRCQEEADKLREAYDKEIIVQVRR